MPVPKRKTSRANTRSRKAQWYKGARAATYASCPQCKKAKLPHHVCQNCGTYAGRQVLTVE